MRRALLFVLLLIASVASAAPFVTATVAVGTAQCGFYMDATAVQVVSIATPTTCKLDLATLAAGAHSVQVDARSAADPIWGTQTTAKGAALNFTKPGPLPAPTNTVLSP
jgi:hypothetical protein